MTESREVTRRQIMDCAPCMAHYYDPVNVHLAGACASVGIEHGKSTQQMLFEYLAAFHVRGHKGRHD